MKTPFLSFLLAALALAISLSAHTREELWNETQAAIDSGLPRTAIEALEPIIASALADAAYPEAIRALCSKISLETQIEGGHAEEAIRRLQAELEKAAPQMRPAMQAILARWYWSYFLENRWRFLQRTQTAEPPGEDFQTWDLARILAEIDARFEAALENEAELKSIPIGDYDALLTKGFAPDAYRPTLFDFLAHEALAFYQTGEQGAVEAEDAFELDAESPIFGDAESFIKWEPATANNAQPGPILKAIGLYQRLLSFHAGDADPSAFLDADLARLRFGYNIAVGESNDPRYRAALERFVAATPRHEIHARALAELASLRYHGDGEPAAARGLAQRGLDAYPESAGGTMCYNLIQEIEAKSATLQTEAVWNDPWPTLDVTYRNVDRVHFRAVAADFLETRSRRYYHTLANKLEDLLAETPALEWEASLPPTLDFKERTERLPAPESLPPGFYCIIASHAPSFAAKGNQLSVAPVWVSSLALITQQRDHGPDTGFVLTAKTGEPARGAKVQAWLADPESNDGPVARVQTDADGRFALPPIEGEVVLLAEHEGQAVSTVGTYWTWDDDEDQGGIEQTIFFTDRALYRPGQSVQYKGICISGRYTSAKYRTLARQAVEVSFRDGNGREIARASHTTNDYGSFSGAFNAPSAALAGAMHLAVTSGPGGSTHFSVEEYKRPKFQVELPESEKAAKLGESVELSGKAVAYTGAAIGGAKVSWRVERSVEAPFWCWWWEPPSTKAIAHGKAVTGVDGSFEIAFPAHPDRDAPERIEPVFVYTIHADVTDSSGETRSASQSARVGYTALQATVAADAWQTAHAPVAFSILTTSLDGAPQSASGELRIHRLAQPENVARAPLRDEWRYWRGADEPEADPTNPDTWELGEVAALLAFETDAKGLANLEVSLESGIYRALVETTDRYGKKVTARQTVHVVDPDSAHFGVKLPYHLAAARWSVEPGETFTALWGTGYESGRAFVEIECDGKILQRYWTDGDRTQQRIELPITEEMRGGASLRVVYVRENRAYITEQRIDVPWSNKRLDVRWETFRSKLAPGQKENWTAVVTGPDAELASAEMVAAMYDASLDQFRPNYWPDRFTVFREEWIQGETSMQNSLRQFETRGYDWGANYRLALWSYRTFPGEVHRHAYWSYKAEQYRSNYDNGVFLGNGEVFELSPFTVDGDEESGYRATSTLAGTRIRTHLRDVGSAISVVTEELLRDLNGQDGSSLLQYTGKSETGGVAAPPPPPELSKVAARRNLAETAFFFPHLRSGEDGAVRIEFAMPEALTEWRFFGFAHDKELRAGLLADTAVTSKDLMVEPNPPRFLREGDAIEFVVKVSNLSDKPQRGQVQLSFADAATLDSADAALGLQAPEQAFDVPAMQSRSYAWRIAVPDGTGFLTYKAVGASERASDGEEGFLPVLSKRILVTESLPLPIRGKGAKDFAFKKLLASGDSDTLRSQSLTVQMVYQPAWYAVMALPYLMEYPYECSEQLFNRLYANRLARRIALSDPKIRRVFDLWKGTPALDSPLEKNQDLKSVLLEETPWLRNAQAESQARRNVGLLFDENRLDEEAERAFQTLVERQRSDGLWSWFPGGYASEYISLYIATGFGRLRHLGVETDIAPALRAMRALDDWIQKRYEDIVKRSTYVLSPTEAFYLYGRSFFLDDQPIAPERREAVDFFLRQARAFWLQVDSRQSQAHLAIALQRFGDDAVPQAIMRSLKERSVSDDELGMFWRDTERSWWWHRAPIETQAMMIEAFAEVAEDAQAVEDCQVWLLKQKQTQDWKTTKATADAIYALLLRGENLLASDARVEVALGGESIRPEKVEAGTGFFEKTFVRGEIRPEMGRISVKKSDKGVSWGSVHWQYLEAVDKVTPHEDTPLRLKKSIFVKETTSKGQVLKPVTGPLAVGDELVVRIELRSDRDMEYLHLKDQRGSGTEPASVLSQHKYQDGLAYYESARDTASHFFIGYLPKGTYVFEYSTRVQLRGAYQTGIAEIQCMYAPEFNSHSESFALEVE